MPRVLIASALMLALTLPLAGSAAAPQAPTAMAPIAAGVRIVAVGDIACTPGSVTTARLCRDADTAALTRSLSPSWVLGLGDMQYEVASLAEFQGGYAGTWGSLRPITRPVPGNHEYGTLGAAGYFDYFGLGRPGYYAWNVKGWRIYNLDSNCSKVNCAAQVAWLRADMDRNPRRCTIMAMHHPRWSSGLEHGNNPSVGPFWTVAYNHRLDIALAGHDHDYERFARLGPRGVLRPYRGIQSFVSGAGGKSLYHLGARKKGSLYFYASQPGVLLLSLRRGEYSWQFRTVDGRTRDSGTRRCV